MKKLTSNILDLIIFITFSLIITHHLVKVGSYLNTNEIDTDNRSFATAQANILRFAAITVETHTGQREINGVPDAIISEYFGVFALFFVFMESSMITFASFYLCKLAFR
jgi:NADH:ubiquinone oxidoreductase subunit 3 (subunit A)